METPGSYIIIVGIFYQLLIQTFSFSRNIYLTIDNMIITTHLVMVFLSFIVHIINCYFKFINQSWTINSKQQPFQNLLKRYRKQLHRQKIKTRKFFPTKNQLLEKTDEATRPTTNKLSDNWDNIVKNHRELPSKKFQFSKVKQWKTLTDCSEGDRKVNNNSPTDRSERDCKVNNNLPTDCSEVYHKVNNNTPTVCSERDRKVNNNSPKDQREEDRKVKNTHLPTKQTDTAR